MTKAEWMQEPPKREGWYWIYQAWRKEPRIECVCVYQNGPFLAVMHGYALTAAVYMNTLWQPAIVPEPPAL